MSYNQVVLFSFPTELCSATVAQRGFCFVMTGIHSGHKAKVSKPRKGGRTPLEKDTTDQTERQPLLETSSVQGALDLLEISKLPFGFLCA
jgi:hypothetical protein